MNITKFKWHNGTENHPVPLSYDMIDALIVKGHQLGNNMEVSGYYIGPGNGKVPSYKVRILQNMFSDLVFKGQTLPDDYVIKFTDGVSTVSEGGEVEIEAPNIVKDYLVFPTDNDNSNIIVSNIDGVNITATYIKNKIHINKKNGGIYLSVDDPTTNDTWSADVKIKTYFQGDESNPTYKETNTITCRALKLDKVILNPTKSRILTNQQTDVNIVYEPSNSTKISKTNVDISVSDNSLASYDSNNKKIISKNISGSFNLRGEYYFDWDPNSKFICDEVKIDILQITKLTIDQTNDRPTISVEPILSNAFTYIKDNIHCYVGKYNNNTMYIRQLDDGDKTRYANDNSIQSALDDIQGNGSIRGDVFVKLPTFYYKGENTIDENTDKVTIFVSLIDPNDGYVSWNGNHLIGAYKATIDNLKLYSNSHRTPVSCNNNDGYNLIDLRNAVSNRGSGFSMVTYQAHVVMALLYYGIYGPETNGYDSQLKVGVGRSWNASSDYYSIANTGGADLLGVNSTTSSSSLTDNCINFLGLEDWWGGISEIFEDVSFSQLTNKLTCGARTNVEYVSGSGYVTKFQFGKFVDFIPKKYKDENDSYNGFEDFCDTSKKFNLCRGAYYSNKNISLDYLGVTAINSGFNNANNYYTWLWGTRLMYLGDTLHVQEVDSFDDI